MTSLTFALHILPQFNTSFARAGQKWDLESTWLDATRPDNTHRSTEGKQNSAAVGPSS